MDIFYQSLKRWEVKTGSGVTSLFVYNCYCMSFTNVYTGVVLVYFIILFSELITCSYTPYAFLSIFTLLVLFIGSTE